MDSSDNPVAGWMLFLLFIVINSIFYGFGSAIQNLNENEIEDKAEQGDRKSKLLLHIMNAPGSLIQTVQFYHMLLSFLVGYVQLKSIMKTVSISLSATAAGVFFTETPGKIILCILVLFVDLILLALLLIGLVLGWRQGFVQALTRIIVVVAALLLASWIAGKLAEPAARWLEPVLTEKLEQRLTAQGNTSDAGEMLAAFGFEGDTLSKLVDSAVQKAQQAGETLLSAVVSTALRSAAYAVVYVVSFLLLLLLLRLVLTPLHLFTKLPVVHGVNALLGGVLGLVKCALLLFLAVWVLQKLQLLVTPELVNKTVLLKFFAQNSPIDLIAKL